MRRRFAIALIALLLLGYVAVPYVRALSLIVRAANMGRSMEAVANRQSRSVTIHPRTTVSSRYGDVPAQLYEPEGTVSRTVLLVPGIHAAGIDEPRLTALA